MKYTASRTHCTHTDIFPCSNGLCVCAWGKDRERVWCDYGYWFLFWLWFLPTSAIQDLLGVAEPSQQPLVQWTIFLLFLGCCMPPSTFCCCLPIIHLAVSCFAPILHTAKMRSRLNLLVGCHSIYSKLYGIKHRVNIVFVCNGRFFFLALHTFPYTTNRGLLIWLQCTLWLVVIRPALPHSACFLRRQSHIMWIRT